MKANELTWKEIKELAEMATKGGYDFNIKITDEGTEIDISKKDKLTVSSPTVDPYPPFFPTNKPSITWEGYNPTITTTTKLKASTDTNAETWSVWTTSGYVDTRKEGESK